MGLVGGSSDKGEEKTEDRESGKKLLLIWQEVAIYL